MAPGADPVAEAVVLVSVLATAAFMLGGAGSVLGARRLAVRCILAGAVLALVAGLLPRLAGAVLAGGPVQVLATALIPASIVAFALKATRLGSLLLVPAGLHWLIWPLARPYLVGLKIDSAVFVETPFAVLMGIWALQKASTAFFGADVGSRVAEEYLIRAIDGAGKLLGTVIAAPLKALRVGRRI